jgi:hypothetical protein
MLHISNFIKQQWLGSFLIVLFVLFLLYGIGQNNELKKELTQFNSELKINKYINLMNETRKKMNIGTTYEDVYFSMHIVDFLDVNILAKQMKF